MARPRTVSDDEILLQAREVFLEHGYHVSTTLIAEAVGLSAPALFKRFGTKEALFVRAMAARMPAWVAQCLQGPDDRPFREQLMELGQAMQAFYAEMSPRFAVLHGSGCLDRVFDAFETPPPIAAFRALTAWFDAAMRAGKIRPLSDPRNAAELLLAAIANRHFTCVLLRHCAPPFSEDDSFLGDLVDTLWSGLAPSTETP